MEGESKHPVNSKTIHMNVLILVLIPFLPADKKADPDFMQMIVGMTTILNIFVRFMSHGKLDFDA
jgi:hypothetical protein